MDRGDFDSVSWRNELGSDGSRPATAGTSDDEAVRQRHDTNGKRRARAVTPPQAGYNADALDLAGVGDGRLECTVDSPLKENDGSKDAFVSYLVTTHVGRSIPPNTACN
jgi:sorting nexin-4